MASKNFLLVSLEESKAKQLAQIVSNDLCRRMLDYLATREKGATESEIAKALSIPLSTAHYNIKQLLQSGIVKAAEFHYSEKGREVLHYSLANKYIIIAPTATKTEGLASKLSRILPVAAIAVAAGFALQFLNKPKELAHSVPLVQERVMEKAAAIASGAADLANQSATTAAEAARAEPGIAVWFILGGLFALGIYFVYDLVRDILKR